MGDIDYRRKREGSDEMRMGNGGEGEKRAREHQRGKKRATFLVASLNIAVNGTVKWRERK